MAEFNPKAKNTSNGEIMRLIDFNCGEYDARREFLRTQKYFIQTFIDPISFSLPSLSNRKNYIIIGQKGAGKTACQLYLENTKTEAEGYLSGLISFYDDLTEVDPLGETVWRPG